MGKRRRLLDRDRSRLDQNNVVYVDVWWGDDVGWGGPSADAEDAYWDELAAAEDRQHEEALELARELHDVEFAVEWERELLSRAEIKVQAEIEVQAEVEVQDAVARLQ